VALKVGLINLRQQFENLVYEIVQYAGYIKVSDLQNYPTL